jgi:hypothetical protein
MPFPFISIENRISSRSVRAAMFVVACFFVAPFATANPLFISVTEWGAGYVCDAGGSSITIPLCSVKNGVGTFARLPSGFMTDPTPGGGTNVLTYLLPVDFGTFDVTMIESANGDNGSDLLRFIGNLLFFYSTQALTGTGNCATGLPLATGCDGVADVKAIPVGAPGSTIVEIHGQVPGSSGLAGQGLFTFLPIAEFNFVSDQLNACPVKVPNCGPLNIAPPADDPYKFITGLTPQPGFVQLAVGQNFNPVGSLVPEPGSVWLILTGMGTMAAGRRWRLRGGAGSKA